MTASRAVLRDKYQHYDLYIRYKTFCVKKVEIKIQEILVLRGQNALGKQKIQFLLQSSCNVNINTVCKLKNV